MRVICGWFNWRGRPTSSRPRPGRKSCCSIPACRRPPTRQPWPGSDRVSTSSFSTRPASRAIRGASAACCAGPVAGIFRRCWCAVTPSSNSLGVEYGRLGSAVFIENGRQLGAAQVNLLRHLANETRNAVRLFGGAALPAHFPPYVGTTAYWALTDKRIAAMLRNSRRTARYFASVLPGDAAELHFAHGLYVTLASERLVDEQRAKQVAAELAQDLSKAGLPLRHAGSFGFDFGAIEWFHHNTSARYAVRIAVADLPTSLWDEVSEAVAQWWSGHQSQRIPASRTNA